MGKTKKNLSVRVPTREELEIINVFKEKPFYEFGISEIMKEAGKKSKPWVFNVLKRFEEEKLLRRRNKGNMNLYVADLDNPALTGHLLFLESLRLIGFKELALISKMISSIPIKNYCLIIFGSHADKEQRADSDLDICFLVESDESEKKIRPYLNEIGLKAKTRIDEHYITFDGFVEMLLRQEENLGKQIFRRHILAFNGAIFYELAKEANKRGFRG